MQPAWGSNLVLIFVIGGICLTTTPCSDDSTLMTSETKLTVQVFDISDFSKYYDAIQVVYSSRHLSIRFTASGLVLENKLHLNFISLIILSAKTQKYFKHIIQVTPRSHSLDHLKLKSCSLTATLP